MEKSYISKIKKSIKELKEQGHIIKRYKFQSFCDNFISDERGVKYEEFNPRDRATTKCMCGHPILYNFKYKHISNGDFFVLGSCCIKKFSTHYQKERKCKECNEPIKKNNDNLCKDCRDCRDEKNRLELYEITRLKLIREYENKCRCKKCNMEKKDDKYKLCYTCKFGETKKKTYTECINCDKRKKEDTYMRCYECNLKKSNK